jgi:hypothetical protein
MPINEGALALRRYLPRFCRTFAAGCRYAVRATSNVVFENKHYRIETSIIDVTATPIAARARAAVLGNPVAPLTRCRMAA